MSTPLPLPPDETSEGIPNPLAWAVLKERYPRLWERAARLTWAQHRRDFPEDDELERAYRADKARGFDARLAFDERIANAITETPQPWQRNGLKAPPFSRDFPERLTRTHELRIFVGRDAWRRAQAARKDSTHAVTLMPPGEDPSGYDWGFCAGRVPLLVNAGALPDEIEKLIAELFVADARAMVAIDQHGNLVVHEVSQP